MWGYFADSTRKIPPHLPLATQNPKGPKNTIRKAIVNIVADHHQNISYLHYIQTHYNLEIISWNAVSKKTTHLKTSSCAPTKLP